MLQGKIYRACVVMAAPVNDYVEVSEREWLALPSCYAHAAHVMIYAEWPGKFLDKYEYKYAVSMQFRFDGTVGFPGGMLDDKETPEQAASRELKEETGYCAAVLDVSRDDHIITHTSEKTRLCLHFFAKKVSLKQLHSIESSMVTASSWGEEVLGLVRVPLYTLPNRLGLPAFLKHQFIGTSRQQLLAGLEHCRILTSSEIQSAVHYADSNINTFVTQNDINY